MEKLSKAVYIFIQKLINIRDYDNEIIDHPKIN
jgi:hypothetical protein